MSRDKQSPRKKSIYDTVISVTSDPSQSRSATVYSIVLRVLAFSGMVTVFVALINIYGAQYGSIYAFPSGMKELFPIMVIVTLLLAGITVMMKSRLQRQQRLYAASVRHQPLNTEQGSMLRQQQMGYFVEGDRELRQFDDWSGDDSARNLGDLLQPEPDDDDDDDDE